MRSRGHNTQWCVVFFLITKKRGIGSKKYPGPEHKGSANKSSPADYVRKPPVPVTRAGSSRYPPLFRDKKKNRYGPLRIVFPAIFLLLFAESMTGQVEPRQVAASGLSENLPLWETAIAAGPERVVALYNMGGIASGACRMGYAIHDIRLRTWIEGIIPLGVFKTACDPSVAYDRTTGDFIAAAFATKEGTINTYIVVSRFSPEQDAFTPRLTPWKEPWTSIKLGPAYDKPWIAAGEALPSGREYYIVWCDLTNYYCIRSKNSGQKWNGGVIKVDGKAVTGGWCAQPAVADNGPLYIAYRPRSGSQAVQFLVGRDVDGNTGIRGGAYAEASGIVFEHLLTGPGQPLKIELHHQELKKYLPGSFRTKMVPQLAVDPTNPDLLYIVYHDTASATSSDADIYINRLVRQGNRWTAGNRIKVNNDDTPWESDQFLPSVTVDDRGYVYVIFYDDRNYAQADGQNEPRARYDAFCAVSKNHGSTFANFELAGASPGPALDFNLSGHKPGEFIGIACWDKNVWTSYSGTHGAAAETSHQTVIYSSRIVVP